MMSRRADRGRGTTAKARRARAGSGFWSNPIHRQWAADGSLLVVTLIWGATFVLVKDMVARVDAIALVGMRFLAATVLMLPVAVLRLRSGGPRLRASVVAAGALIGLALFTGYTFQTMGLRFTTASKAGFITGLSVVLVPILSTIILRRPPELSSVVGVVLATAGLALLTLEPGDGPALGAGDLLVLAGAVAFGLHIVAVGKFAPRCDVVVLVVVQLATVSIVAFAALALRAAVLGQDVSLPPLSGRDLTGVGFLALFATTLAFLVQNVAQKFTSPTHVAIVFAMEPVFAGFFGWLLLGERLTVAQYLGAALILAGMIASEVRLSPGPRAQEGGEDGVCGPASG